MYFVRLIKIFGLNTVNNEAIYLNSHRTCCRKVVWFNWTKIDVINSTKLFY